MFEVILLTLGLTALLVVLFWLVIAGVAWMLDGNLGRFKVAVTLEDSENELPDGAALEKAKAQAVSDIQENNIPGFATGGLGEKKEAMILTLLNEGIAENRTASYIDDKGDPESRMPGDSWLCDRRPIWFTALQLLPGLVLLVIFGALHGLWYGITSSPWPFPAALVVALVTVVCQLLWTGYLAWISAIQVDANFRLGIKRFGEQLDGFLAPGLQFVLPWGIEQPESVTLQLAVWGPREEEDLQDQFRIGGTAIGNGNPEPGRFETQLLGFWPLEITVEFALGLYRQKPMAKMAWWLYLNQYRTLSEVGQAMAQIAMPIVFKTAREVSVEIPPQNQGGAQGGIQQDKTPAEDPKLAKEALSKFVNRMPEMAGKILLALIGAGPRTLGGFLIRRVAITTVVPGPAYREMMQSANRAEIERYNQDVIGQAAARRWERFQAQLTTIPTEQRPAFIAMAQQEVNRVLYERVGAGTDILGVLLSQLTTKQAQQPGPEGEKS